VALSWLTALKAVPWADVVQAAPEIVQGARKLFNAAKTYAGSQGNAATGAHGTSGDALDGRLRQIEAGLQELRSEQRTSAELIRSLAEQNASIVAALDVMRKRVRAAIGACIVLAVALAAFVLVTTLR
jgi:hypothetical protein